MKTIDKINEAIKSLNEQGITPTQKLVCKESGLSIATVKRHWKGVCESKQGITEKKEQGITRLSEIDRVSPQGITETVNRESKESNQGITKSSNPDFERLKRYKPSGNLKLNPQDF